MKLKEKIGCRPFVNSADHGRVVEIFRGNAEIKEVLEDLRQVTLVTLHPGMRAGGHVHAVKKEILYVVNGWLKGVFRDRVTGETLSLQIDGGRKVTLLPGVEHVFVNDSDEDVQLIEFSSLAFDEKNRDAEKVELEG